MRGQRLHEVSVNALDQVRQLLKEIGFELFGVGGLLGFLSRVGDENALVSLLLLELKVCRDAQLLISHYIISRRKGASIAVVSVLDAGGLLAPILQTQVRRRVVLVPRAVLVVSVQRGGAGGAHLRDHVVQRVALGMRLHLVTPALDVAVL